MWQAKPQAALRKHMYTALKTSIFKQVKGQWDNIAKKKKKKIQNKKCYS